MFKVNDEHIDFILNDIEARGVVLEDLQYNLLDHMCCIIEEELAQNGDFDSFYKKLLPRFFKDNLKEIQEETDNLLIFKNYFAMKNTLNISGITSAILLLIGSLFKVLHLPGASIVIVLGALLFSFIFMPLMIVLKLKDEERTTDKIVLSFGFLLGIIGMMGFLLKLMHWPGANILMVSGIGTFVFIYVPLYFFTRVRRPDIRFNTIVNSVLMMSVGGMLFAMINISSNQKLSHSIILSQEAIDSRKTELWLKNDSIYHNIENKDAQAYHHHTLRLRKYIDGIKVHLMMTENPTMTKDEALNLKQRNIRFPNDQRLVSHGFTTTRDTYSPENLLKEVELYNQALAKFNFNSSEVQLKDFDLENTITSLFLTDLNQIQYQIAVNEYGYLNSIR